MMTINTVEVWSVQTPDGKTYYFDNDANSAILELPSDLGLPPIQWDTFKGYKQDGETEIGWSLLPRNFTLKYTGTKECREDFWTLRSTLLDYLRPNRTSRTAVPSDLPPDGGKSEQHILTLTSNGGETLRSIYCRFNSPTFPEAGDWQEFSVSEDLQVECFDPIWFNPEASSNAIAKGTDADWIFGAVFSEAAERMRFFSPGYWATASIDYSNGTFYAYPVITITGSAGSVTLRHLDTNAVIQVERGIGSGQVLTIDVENVSVALADGTNYLPFVSPNSDFTKFRIVPANLAINGVNRIAISLPGSDANTAVTISYNERYIGI